MLFKSTERMETGVGTRQFPPVGDRTLGTAIVAILRAISSVDFAQFVEPPPPLPRQVSQRSRREFPNDGRSVVGLIDKAALLEAVERESDLRDEVTPAQALAVTPERRCFCLGRCNREIFRTEA